MSGGVWPVEGLCLVGTFGGVRGVSYGAAHPSKAGQPVPGMYDVIVNVTNAAGEVYERRASFFRNDKDSGEPTRVAQELDSGITVGEPLMVVVKTRSHKDSDFVNLDAVRVVAVAAPDQAGESEGRRRPLRAATA
jgi:hypothetical protein